MDESRKIVMLKHMLDDDGTPEDVLLAYLDIAGQRILNRMYPYKEDYTGLEVPDRFAIVQLNVAVYLLNKRGAEGQVQHIENGVHRNYGSSDVPEEMLKDVYPFAQAIR
jgi:hypothetical protein